MQKFDNVNLVDVSKESRKGYGQRKNDGTHDAKAVDSSNGKAAFKNLK